MPKTRRPLVKRLSRVLKRGVRPALNRFLARYSRVGDPVVFDNSLFPWIRLLEDQYTEIRNEAIRLGELHDVLPTFDEISPYQRRISKGGGWKTVWLHGFGHDSEIAQKLCPVTAGLIEQVPELQTALFSLLAPGTHIPAHRGVYKGLVNYHLGIIVPKQADKCRMQVGDEQVIWQPGKSVVFDDTNTHEVWNESGEERVVLMLQFHRPFRAPGRQLSRLFLWGLQFTPYLRKPRQNVRLSDERLSVAAEQRGMLATTPGSKG
jgi:aspartyl/asparaginyl beta-hydroxylase (cupin superfamily)